MGRIREGMDLGVQGLVVWADACAITPRDCGGDRRKRIAP